MMNFFQKMLIHLEMYSYLFFSIVYVIQSCIMTLVPRRYRRRNIRGKVVLITGGANGIGKSTAKKLAEKGAKIIIWDVNEKCCLETEEEIRLNGDQCFSYVVDVTDRTAIKETAQKVKLEHGMVDILVNNAGICREVNFLTDPEELILQHFHINAISHFWLLRAFLPDMKKARSGHIVTISSIAGKFGAPKMLVYCATKFATCGLDESLRYELDSQGLKDITTTLVCPFFVNTQMSKGVKARLYPNLSVEYVSSEIVDAILLRTRRVILPPVLRMMTTLKGFVHNKVEGTISEASIGKNPFKNAEWMPKGVSNGDITEHEKSDLIQDLAH